MTFDWYKIFNLTEFEDTELVSRTVEVILDGVGRKSILITRGNLTAILFDDVFLPIGLTSANPFVFESKAVYVDEADDVWLGVAVAN